MSLAFAFCSACSCFSRSSLRVSSCFLSSCTWRIEFDTNQAVQFHWFGFSAQSSTISSTLSCSLLDVGASGTINSKHLCCSDLDEAVAVVSFLVAEAWQTHQKHLERINGFEKAPQLLSCDFRIRSRPAPGASLAPGQHQLPWSCCTASQQLASCRGMSGMPLLHLFVCSVSTLRTILFLSELSQS